MVDRTELPKMHPRTPGGVSGGLSSESSIDLILENDSEYEIPEYPPMRVLNLQAVPKKPALKPVGSPRNPAKLLFESEPTFFDCCKNGELELVTKFVSEMK